jgi:hypothetical protein
MKRRAVGRDTGLTLRMLLALLLLAAFYAGIVAGVAAIFWCQPGWLVYGIVICLVVVLSAVAHYGAAESLVLRSARARFPDSGSEPRLERPLERLAQLAEAASAAARRRRDRNAERVHRRDRPHKGGGRGHAWADPDPRGS